MKMCITAQTSPIMVVTRCREREKVTYSIMEKGWDFVSKAYKKRMLKFIYSEKAIKFCEISTVDLSFVVPVKSMVEISQNFEAFSEYMNFN